MTENSENKATSKVPAIGIDLGTTYSCVGVFKNGFIEILSNESGNRTTPSYVAFTKEGRLVGEAAKGQATNHPENTVHDVKRLIGRKFTDAAVQENIERFAFEVINKNGKPEIKVEEQEQEKEKLFSPEEISAMVLAKMKHIAESNLNMTVTNAVITVPAYFDNAQRQATKDAGTIAGLNVLRIINEPTAAALAYGLDKQAQGNRNVLVFDLGGGTLDVTILTIVEGFYEVLSTSGNTFLGGRDFDHRVAKYFADEFHRKHKHDIRHNKQAMRRLEHKCEQTKITLSAQSSATLEITSLAEGKDFSGTITRAKFEDLCADLFESTLEPVEKALADAKLDKMEIDDIVLVGGSSRIPKIQRLLQEYFNGKQLNTSINPDEAVAYGAAVQASVLNGDDAELYQHLLLVDVTPLSLGIAVEGGKMETLIRRNSTIPAKETKVFSTSTDNQPSVMVQVFEGERAMVNDNKLLDRFILEGFPLAPARVPQIEVTFEINVNGILVVSAVEKNTGLHNEVTINHKDLHRMSTEEVERKLREAQLYELEDRKLRDRVTACNSLKHYVEHVRKVLDQPTIKVKITQEDRNTIERALEDAVNWVTNNCDQLEKEQVEEKRTQLENLCKPLLVTTFGEQTSNESSKDNRSMPEPTPRRNRPIITEMSDDED